MADTEKKPDDEQLKWIQQSLPTMYLQLESILYQTHWVLEQELKRLEKKARAAKDLVENNIGKNGNK